MVTCSFADNSRLSQALSSYEFSQFDLKTLIGQVVSSGSNLFGAELCVLARADEPNKMFEVNFDRGGEQWGKKIPMGAGPLGSVYRSRLPLSLAVRSAAANTKWTQQHIFFQPTGAHVSLVQSSHSLLLWLPPCL